MKTKDLFKKIIKNNDVIKILENLGMHNIRDKGDYISCGQPDGDNPSSVIVYKDNLWVTAYTRDIADKYGNTNIISLVSFIRNSYFSQSKKWICDLCEYDYYEEPSKKTDMLKFLDYIYSERKSETVNEDEVMYLKPVSEDVLQYYGTYSNRLFISDGISVEAQYDFEIGYDLETHAITIPIRDELGTLVGVKARIFKDYWEIEDWESKYFYIVPCAKSRVLYGLHKTMPYITRSRSAYIVESEKSVIKLWGLGVRNVVSIGGHQLSKTHVKKIVQLGVDDIFLCFDEDVSRNDSGKVDLEWYKNVASKFLPCQNVYGLIDLDGSILKPKDSPVDNMDNFYKLNERKIILSGV